MGAFITYHLIKWQGNRFSATGCGANTWDGDGLSTDNPARVTCAACLAVIALVAKPEPITYVEHQPKPAQAKALRKKSRDLGTAAKAQDGFDFGGAL